MKVDQSRNGVRVIVTHQTQGTVVEASCQCFGHPARVHSNEQCTFLRQNDGPRQRQ